LLALEKNNSQLSFFYAVLEDDHHNAIAFASFQILDFYIDSLQTNHQGLFYKISCIGRSLKIIPKEKPLKILNCGNPFVSGEHGIFIKPDIQRQHVLSELSKAILSYTEENFHESIDIFIMKDFSEASLSMSRELIISGYYAFNVEPNMKLEIPSEWNSFEDYLKAMKTKFRVKAKKALKISKEIEAKEITADNFDEHLKSMTELYLQVASKASFNLSDFNLKTYKTLKEHLGDAYVLKSYWLENQMVGFLSGMINKNSLDAHFVGIDYDKNRSHGIYQRMLYDYIQLAIDRNLNSINFGRTASEIKSSVGAVPEHLTVYIRHKKTITNKFLRLFLSRIQPTEFHQKFPFKHITT
jgi:predicted N-acyltransferase